MTRRMLCVLGLVSLLPGCFMRDPLDPRGELDHRVIGSLVDAERMSHSREAFERARQRVGRVESGMTVPEVESAMQAMVMTEQHGEKEDDALRQKVIEGILCRRNPSSLRRRWIFGYDEDGVEFIGFALEFQRPDPDSEKWVVRSIDRKPTDDCPDPDEQ